MQHCGIFRGGGGVIKIYRGIPSLPPLPPPPRAHQCFYPLPFIHKLRNRLKTMKMLLKYAVKLRPMMNFAKLSLTVDVYNFPHSHLFFVLNIRSWPLLTSSFDPLDRPKVTASSDHYYHSCHPSVRPPVCTYPRPHISKPRKTK